MNPKKTLLSILSLLPVFAVISLKLQVEGLNSA